MVGYNEGMSESDSPGFPPAQTGHGTGHDVPREVSEEAADSRGTEWIDNLGRSQFGAPDQASDDRATQDGGEPGTDPPA